MDMLTVEGGFSTNWPLTVFQSLTSLISSFIVSGMEQFGTEPWCRHQLATVLWSVTDVRDDEDPFRWRTATAELASSRATMAECQIAEWNGLVTYKPSTLYNLVLPNANISSETTSLVNRAIGVISWRSLYATGFMSMTATIKLFSVKKT